MKRRQVWSVLAGLAAVPFMQTAPAGAHTPYAQWVVYRKKHLLIGSHRADGATYKLAKSLASTLATHLPRSQCRVARAPNAGRLASLLGTDQLDVVVLNQKDAEAMHDGTGAFAPYGRIALRKLVDYGALSLLAHDRFPDRHAWLVVATLVDNGAPVPADLRDQQRLSWHAGAKDFYTGKPEPGDE